MAKKIWDNEKELAKVVVDHLRNEGWTVYPEIYDIDIVAKKDDPSCHNGIKLIGIECKIHFNLKVLGQAYRKKRHVDEVFVAVSDGNHDDEHFGRRVASKFGIGAYFVRKRVHHPWKSFDGQVHGGKNEYTVSKTLDAVFSPRDKDDIETLLEPQAENFAEAGQAGGKHWSAFQQTASKIREYVQANPGKTLKEVVAAVPHHYANPSSARSALSKLIGSVIDGIERKDGKLYPTSAGES